jgi:hypothetical protein
MKLTTILGAAGALALGTFGALSAVGGHPSAAHHPTAVPLARAGNVSNNAPQTNGPATAPLLPAAAPATPPATPETDSVQSGDQSTPDVAGQGPDSESTADTPESPGTQSDGPGGHQDNGSNVDHQFNGNE